MSRRLNRHRLTPLCIPALLVLLVLLGGCGSDGVETVPVSGTVTLDGQPVSAGFVEFHPAEAAAGTAAGTDPQASGGAAAYTPVGTIGEGGRYTLSTRSQEGAPVGRYNVVVRVTAPPDPNNPYAAPEVLSPARYSNPDTTDLHIEVVVEPVAGAYDLKLTK